jgi:hypothetical protein
LFGLQKITDVFCLFVFAYVLFLEEDLDLYLPGTFFCLKTEIFSLYFCNLRFYDEDYQIINKTSFVVTIQTSW